MELEWVCKTFDALSVVELYKILQLRCAVFVVEQNCPYQDLDNKDLICHHLSGWQGHQLAAYTRLVPAGKSFAEIAIGRVVISAAFRKGGLGKALMQKSIEHCYSIFGPQDIRIGAQLYLKKFYEGLGFAQCSDVYDEDGIEHIEMILVVK